MKKLLTLLISIISVYTLFAQVDYHLPDERFKMVDDFAMADSLVDVEFSRDEIRFNQDSIIIELLFNVKSDTYISLRFFNHTLNRQYFENLLSEGSNGPFQIRCMLGTTDIYENDSPGGYITHYQCFAELVSLVAVNSPEPLIYNLVHIEYTTGFSEPSIAGLSGKGDSPGLDEDGDFNIYYFRAYKWGVGPLGYQVLENILIINERISDKSIKAYHYIRQHIDSSFLDIKQSANEGLILHPEMNLDEFRLTGSNGAYLDHGVLKGIPHP